MNEWIFHTPEQGKYDKYQCLILNILPENIVERYGDKFIAENAGKFNEWISTTLYYQDDNIGDLDPFIKG
tara:strand:+ start:344 stop:553 length:210 start_codon:yes stop_codon:yes gene_type:complete